MSIAIAIVATETVEFEAEHAHHRTVELGLCGWHGRPVGRSCSAQSCTVAHAVTLNVLEFELLAIAIDVHRVES